MCALFPTIALASLYNSCGSYITIVILLRCLVTKPSTTTGFPSFFPTFWYQFRLLLCYHMIQIHNDHVITFLCHYDVTTNTHIMWPVPCFLSHSMTLSLLLYIQPLYLSIRTTSLLDVLLTSLLKGSLPFYKDNLPSGRSPYFPTQRLFTSPLGPPPFLTLSLTSLYTSLSQRSHSTPSLYDPLLLAALYSHSTTFLLLLPYITISQNSHSTTHSLLPYSYLSHTLPYVSRQSLLYILWQRRRRTSLRLHCLLIYLLAPKPTYLQATFITCLLHQAALP